LYSQTAWLIWICLESKPCNNLQIRKLVRAQNLREMQMSQTLVKTQKKRNTHANLFTELVHTL